MTTTESLTGHQIDHIKHTLRLGLERQKENAETMRQLEAAGGNPLMTFHGARSLAEEFEWQYTATLEVLDLLERAGGVEIKAS